MSGEPRGRVEDTAPSGRSFGEVGGLEEMVAALGAAQLAKLRRDLHKRHWRDLTGEYLMGRLLQEVEELDLAMQDGDYETVLKESADVANFAGMIADRLR